MKKEWDIRTQSDRYLAQERLRKGFRMEVIQGSQGEGSVAASPAQSGCMDTPASMPVRLKKACAALKARLLSSVGTGKPSPFREIPELRGISSSRSKRSTGTMMETSSWYPSDRRPVTFNLIFSLAGALTVLMGPSFLTQAPGAFPQPEPPAPIPDAPNDTHSSPSHPPDPCARVREGSESTDTGAGPSCGTFHLQRRVPGDTRRKVTPWPSRNATASRSAHSPKISFLPQRDCLWFFP